MILLIYSVAVSKLVPDLMPIANKKYRFQLPDIRFLPDVRFLGFLVSRVGVAGAYNGQVMLALCEHLITSPVLGVQLHISYSSMLLWIFMSYDIRFLYLDPFTFS